MFWRLNYKRLMKYRRSGKLVFISCRLQDFDTSSGWFSLSEDQENWVGNRKAECTAVKESVWKQSFLLQGLI